MKALIPQQEAIVHKICLIRGQKVMLDRDLARLYGVLTKVLNQGVKRNMASKSDRMGLRRPPYAFTDYEILMLSSVLNSQRAIQVNIAIMRVFVRLGEGKI